MRDDSTAAMSGVSPGEDGPLAAVVIDSADTVRSSDHQVSDPRYPSVDSATACVAASRRRNSAS